MKFQLPSQKRVYFASDQHLGAPTYTDSRQRETQFVRWLDHIEKDVHVLFLLGDLFDFWFDYRKVVPKGFVRTLGKLAEFRDKGIDVIYFVGNHDLWMKDYFSTELGIPVYHRPQAVQIDDTHFLLGHGDGLGPGDKGYKRMKKVFVHPFSKWLFGWLHPDLGVTLAQHLSIRNRLISGDDNVTFQGPESEWLVHYCRRKLKAQHVDYFVFGHRHLPLELPIEEKAMYINTGDWIHHKSYAVFDGNKMVLDYWK